MRNYLCICPIVSFSSKRLVPSKPVGPGGFGRPKFKPKVRFFPVRGKNESGSVGMGTKMTHALASSFFEALFFLFLHSDSVCGKDLLAEVKQK